MNTKLIATLVLSGVIIGLCDDSVQAQTDYQEPGARSQELLDYDIINTDPDSIPTDMQDTYRRQRDEAIMRRINSTPGKYDSPVYPPPRVRDYNPDTSDSPCGEGFPCN